MSGELSRGLTGIYQRKDADFCFLWGQVIMMHEITIFGALSEIGE